MFTIRNYPSDEIYDLGKFMDFVGDCYNVIDCPFLDQLRKLPTVNYFYVDTPYVDIDMISMAVYGDPFLWYYIQYYNDRFEDRFYQGDKLNLFSMNDLASLYHNLSNGVINGNY